MSEIYYIIHFCVHFFQRTEMKVDRHIFRTGNAPKRISHVNKNLTFQRDKNI